MSQAFTSHGTFIYDADATIQYYGSVESVAAALKDLDMHHAWIRVHGAAKIHELKPTITLIETLQQSGIGVAGWGWCQGEDIKVEAKLARDAIKRFNLVDYVADVEHGVNDASWTTVEIQDFFSRLRDFWGNGSKICLSTFSFIDWHEPHLIEAADPFVDYFAPQVYWLRFPNSKMLKAVSASQSDYPLNDPVSYTNLCIDRWQRITNKGLIITGQAYWNEPLDFTRDDAEDKVKNFVENFFNWSNISGLNWWHIGGKSKNAMSYNIYQYIKNAKLNRKFLSS